MKKKRLLFMLFAFLAFGPTAWAQSIVSVSYIDADGGPQTVNATLLDEIASVNPNGATIGTSGFTNWYVVQGSNVVMNGQLGYNGGINLILCDGAKLTVNNTGGNAIQSLDNTDTKYTLTIYVQTNGTGQLVATATGDKAIQTENLTIHGGTISATGGAHGIYAPASDIIINGGAVTASAPSGNAIEGYNVTINGGIVSATGNGGIQNGQTGQTILGYTNNTDRITATNYQNGNTASTRIKDGQYMITDNGVIVYGWLNENKRNAIAGHTLSPYTPTEWSGSGTAQSPYIIATVDDLNLLSLRTNGGTHPYSDTCFKLGANITYTPSTTWNDATSTEHNFTAIAGFDGHFDGDSYTISGLRIYADDFEETQNGLFTSLGPNAYIEDLTISNARITGEKQIGAIAGYVYSGATVTNCHVTGTVTVHAWGHTLENHGGVVGYNAGTVSNCVSEATISRSSSITLDNGKAGGIAGTNAGTLSNNKVFNANITAASSYGAIAGLNDGGTLTNNYYRACTVNGTANATGVGCNGADVTTGDGAMSIHTITKPNDVTINTEPTLVYGGTNYWKHGTTITLSGGLGGTPTAGWQKAYCINGVVISENSTTISHDFDMPAEDVTITIGEIHADWATSGAQGTEQDPYLIYFPDQLDLLATRVNAGESYSGKYFKLMDDLTYDNTQQNNYTAIGNGSNPFSGHFDGNQKTIEGIRIYGTGSYQGVFGYIVDAEVKDLYVNDIVITGHDRVGSIVGECDGGTTITDCRVTTATLNVAGDASYQQLFGGIAGRKSGSTMSNNFVIGITIPQVYHTGAIAGENGSSSQSLVSNYYHNCTVGSTARPTGVGCNLLDVEGAKPVFTLTLADGISTDVSPVVNYNTVDYCVAGVTINLSYVTPANPGYRHIYSVNSESIEGDSFVLNANAEVSIEANQLIDWETEYVGTEDDPYLIGNAQQWNNLADRVEIGNTYSGKYFKLIDDISVTFMVGGGDGSSNVFSGTFDGDGHTISFSVASAYATEQYIAPFRRIDGATIRGLKLEGSVTSNYRFAGGIVAYAKGTSTVTDCVNSTSITNNDVNDVSNGGIVGMVGDNGTINITGCVFNGQMNGTTNSNNTWSGILGLCNSGCTANISHCLVDPVSAVEHGNTIYRSSGTTHWSNCYYTKTIGNAQGKLAHSITGGENITVENAGTPSSNTNVGVIGYGTGIKYDGVLYAGNGENVSLNLGATDGYVVPGNFTASGGTLSGTSNPYTLTMRNANVIITATIGFPLEVNAGRWYAISSPMHNSGNDETVAGVTHLTDVSYDLLRYDEANAIWRNQKPGNGASGFSSLVRGRGYIYRRNTNETLIFTGEPNTGDVSYTLSNTAAQGELAGWHLVGNPYPQSISTSTPYYSLSADGAWVLGNGTIAAGQAVLVYTANDNATITFSTTESDGMVISDNKGSIPAVPKGLSLGDGCDDSDNQAIAQSHKQDFAHLNGDQLLITLPGHLEAYDMMGRCLFGRQLNSFPTTLPTTLFPGTGVYVLRLDGKSQKIMVR